MGKFCGLHFVATRRSREAPSRPARGSCFAQKQSVACPSVEATDETAVGEGCHRVAWYVNKGSFVMTRRLAEKSAHIVSWLTLHQKHSTHGSVSYVQRHTSETRSSSHARRKVAKQTPDHTNSGMKVKGQSRTADLRVSGITPQHSRLDIRSES